MGPTRAQRHLAAIVCADVAGYSRLMGTDEEGTLARLNAILHEIVEPGIAARGGRIAKTTGDGLLIEFASSIEAVRWAVEAQNAIAAHEAEIAADLRIAFRIGINVGDIIDQDGDLYGDGVNIAARLETLAEPGGIVISDAVHQQVRNKLTLAFESLGEQRLKNIAEPTVAYRVHPADALSTASNAVKLALALPDRPSLAVLPFTNMSGDPEQEYFADGIVEDIITALSHFRWLFVIARNSSFTYKGRAVDITRVGRELGVRYLLEGSVRKFARRVRITAQLVEAATGRHIWADKFDRDLADIFELQDEITERVVSAIDPAMRLVETQRAIREPAVSAWDHFLRGSFHFNKYSRQENERARHHFERAVALDSQFAMALAQLARTYYFDAFMSWTDTPEQSIETAFKLAERAVALDDMESLAHSAVSVTALFLGRHDTALRAGRRTLELNQNNPYSHASYGQALTFSGRPAEAIGCFQAALRISPHDPMRWAFWGTLGLAHYCVKDYAGSVTATREAIAVRADYVRGQAVLVAALAQLGAADAAESERLLLQRLAPGTDPSRLTAVFPFRDAADFEHLRDGLRKAGMSLQ